ncbi:PQQ-binding-like beta-propeller repeat protein [Streptomyces sp. PR69]|uniref:outer membrane protein assembly factor BamB family protein n=1 Tax=Streptomyces sp. PR69 TaxID=2984950 RepID=UPI002263E4F7|nr:PQQ-binding-like beta-propeller repeat protein [Streptomyces sp. PR69]
MSSHYPPPPQGSPAPYPHPAGQPPRSAPKSRALIALLTVAGLVLVSAVAGGIWLLTGAGGDDDAEQSKKTTAEEAPIAPDEPWSLPYKASSRQPDGVDLIRGLWFVGRTVVRAQPDGLVAVDHATGKQQWTTSAPESATGLCQASDGGFGDVAVLLAATGGDGCTLVYAVDLTSGKLLWQRTLSANREVKGVGVPRIARSSDVAVVSTPRKAPAAFRVSDGKELWNDRQALGPQSCQGSGYTGGRRLLRVQRCITGLFESTEQLAAVDPATGRALWTYDADPEDRLGSPEVLQTSPIVIDISELKDRLTLQVLTDDGKLRTTLTGQGRGLSVFRVKDGSPSWDVQVRGDRLFALANPVGLSSENNRMIGWSLTTGEQLWERPSTGKFQSFSAVHTDGDGVLAYMHGNVYDPAKLIRFDPGSGEATTVREYPADPRGPRVGIRPVVQIHKDTLFLAAGDESRGKDADADPELRSLIARPMP